MENIVYKRDYKEEKLKRDWNTGNSISNQIFNYTVSSGVMNAMEDAYLRMPRVINEEHQTAYERILSALDQITKIFGGQIQGVVDYKNWEASIVVILPFVEFSSEEELQLMMDIASNSQTVTFTAAHEGSVRMKLLIDYFDIVGNVGNILGEEIANCPELVAMLEEADKAEKKQLLANPQIAMMVQIGAESTGVSEEEYLDKVVSFLRNPPKDCLNTVQSWIEDHSC